ncbi:methyltransferase [Schizosaccharomyces pombe]|uniref:Uncharacterized methyltransferase C70.08c n=1 Tax=Schizosaccharomyces pombe (strain 972 / ATCC 24843) TaxID=284812 RepID=YJ48_SCHPO|nr:putative methyltransferase [Schizosaccharomyces pombe]O74529.1 RecName: Full=Uncharacterized methyltransferase C70.08c [Schizosaccharomyces pombe 972h-]CAA19358.1 methyltransferase (predicted) [Schizosaccharomyces pombe]|eukprot:NP_588543.1 putative methyltransferase [Schizosaccharomyces pombe]
MPEDYWSAKDYQRNASFVPKLTKDIVKRINLSSSDELLDLGCGDGVLTNELVSQCRRVVGIDASPDMIKAARELGLNAYVIPGEKLLDASEIPSESFDVVFSNAALHWIMRQPKNRPIVMKGVSRVLRTKGRFVAECGAFGNVSEVVGSIYSILLALGATKEQIDQANPWFFGSEDDYTRMLEEAGFHVEYVENISRPTLLNKDVREWLDTFAQHFYHAFPQWKDIIRETVYNALLVTDCRSDGKWFLQYRRLRFVAHKE